jgi:ribosomal protein S12 methylthiotransferase
MALQARISAARLASRVGTTMTVLVDAVGDEEVVARGPGDAPEIDGIVRVPGAWALAPGDFIEVRITGSDEHDLVAEPVE